MEILTFEKKKQEEDEEQDKSSMPDEAFPSSLPASPLLERQIPRPPPPRQKAVMPENVTFFPPIPGCVASKSKVVPDKPKIQQHINNNGSMLSYGKNINRVPESTIESYGRKQVTNTPMVTRKSSVVFPSLHNTQQYLSSSATSSLYQQDAQSRQDIHKYFAVPPQKPQVALPPLQSTQHRSQQLSSNGKPHQDFMQYDESIAFKRSTTEAIAEPNIIRKDSAVRPRAPKQTDIITHEVAVRDSIKRQQELLPMIPQLPPRRPNNSKVHARFSDIPRPCPPPQPPTRLRPVASHRRYVISDSGLPFPRRQ